jgi:methyl-accepting chemotaxis protein
MFGKLKLSVKIGLGYGVVVLVLAVVGSYSYVTFMEANAQWESFDSNEIAKQDLIIAGSRTLGNATHHFKNYIIRGGDYDKTFAADIAELKHVASSYRAVPEVSKEEHQLLDEIDNGADLYISDMNTAVKMREAGANILEMDKNVIGADQAIYTAFIKLQKMVARDTDETSHRFNGMLEYAENVTGLLVLFSTLFSVAVAFWLTTTISRNILTNAAQLSAASSEIAATITQHERTASQQSAAVNETSSTIDELSASSRQSAEQAANSATLAERSSTATTEGGETTQQTVKAMNSLKHKIGTMADQILHLGEQSGQIGNIATLLKDLAGQINMLALNAAVEAARAGEHGKGFAVVASEIRKLADQSKKSAEQTAVLVADIQKATNTSIMVTDDGTRTVTEVTQLVQKVAQLFDNLANLANSVNENAQQMMLNTKQQSAALAQVAEATNSIAAGAKETVTGIGQTKIGVQNLNAAAENLKAIV